MRNIPEGYKREKNRIVPIDWNFVKIDSILRRIGNKVDVNKEESYKQIGIRSHGKGLFYKQPVTGEELGNKSVFWIEKECFIVNIVFAWEQAIGKTTKNEVGMICSHRFPMYRAIDNKVDVNYLIYLFKTPYGKKVLELASPGGAGRNKTLGQKEFTNSEILIPNLVEEQKKIIEILSTWDLAIAKQEKLIETKKELKNGVMQKFLNGEIRFIGFNEDWKVYKYINILKEVKRNIEFNDERIYDLISVKRRTGGLFHRQSLLGAEIKTKKLKSVEIDDFLISKMQIVHGASGIVTSKFAGMYISNSYIALVAKKTSILDINFFNYISQTPRFYNQTYRSSYGVHIEKMTFNIELFMEEKIKLPSVSEQKRIVSIIDKVNEEIELLQKELEALRVQKKGLMQRLLTGEVRVKND